MSKTSVFDNKIARYQRRTELFIMLSKAVEEDPSLIPELLEILEEYSNKDTGRTAPEDAVSATSLENADGKEDNEDENAPSSQMQTGVTIRKGTPDFLEYKTRVGAAVVDVLKEIEKGHGITAGGVYLRLSRSGKTKLRPENDSAKGMGKLLPLLVKDGFIRRFRIKGKWYYGLPSA